MGSEEGNKRKKNGNSEKNSNAHGTDLFWMVSPQPIPPHYKPFK
jgi:hypothetical protein